MQKPSLPQVLLCFIGGPCLLWAIRALCLVPLSLGLAAYPASLALLAFLCYRSVRLLGGWVGLTPADCRIKGRPRFTALGLGLALLYPLFALIPLVLLPGRWIVHNPSSGEARMMIAEILYAALASGIAEEFMWRGLMTKVTELRWGRKTAVLLPSLIFAGAHLLNGPLAPAEAALMLVLFTGIGVNFALLTYRSDRIWDSVAAHTLYNIAISVVNFDPSIDNWLVSRIPSNTLPVWLTGGPFGASVPAILLMWGCAGALAWTVRRRTHTPEGS